LEPAATSRTGCINYYLPYFSIFHFVSFTWSTCRAAKHALD
jgi:hypothetical protein